MPSSAQVTCAPRRCSSSTLQGFELAALEGCASLLDRFAAVYVEGSFVPLYADLPLADEILAHLRESGFRLVGVHNLVHDREPLFTLSSGRHQNFTTVLPNNTALLAF